MSSTRTAIQACLAPRGRADLAKLMVAPVTLARHTGLVDLGPPGHCQINLLQGHAFEPQAPQARLLSNQQSRVTWADH